MLTCHCRVFCHFSWVSEVGTSQHAWKQLLELVCHYSWDPVSTKYQSENADVGAQSVYSGVFLRCDCRVMNTCCFDWSLQPQRVLHLALLQPHFIECSTVGRSTVRRHNAQNMPSCCCPVLTCRRVDGLLVQVAENHQAAVVL